MRVDFGGDARAKLLEQLDLALENALVGAEDFLLVFLQRRRDEPLAAGDRLLAVVVRRHRVQIRFRDLDVVAEHAVVAHLQRVDAGARALALFELGDHLLARAADAAQVVELGVEAVADVAAVAHQRTGIVDEAAVDVVAHVDEIVQRAHERSRQRRFACLEEQPDARHDRNRLLQADEIARPGIAERGARDEALEILHAFQDLAELAAVGAAKRELLDGVQAIANAIERDERPQQPGAQQASGHGGDRAVDLVQQGALAAALHRFDNLEVLQRDGIDEQAVGRRLVGDAADVREVGLLRVAQVVRAGRRRPTRPTDGRRGRILRDRSSGTDRAACVARIHARTSTARRASPAADRPPRRAGPGSGRDRRAATISRGRSTITSSASACSPALPAYSAHENSPVVRSSSATPTTGSDPVFRVDSVVRGSDPGQRQEKRGRALVEMLRVGQRTRRHHAHDFAFDDALGFFRIFDLIADGDAEAFLHQAREIRVQGMMRNAAHGNRRALAVFRAGCQRQIEGARRDQRVLVEHLVEVPHAEKQNRVAILLLRVEILPHRRRDVRGVPCGTTGVGM